MDDQADRDRRRLERICQLRACLDGLPIGWRAEETIGDTIGIFPAGSDESAGFVRVTDDGIDASIWARHEDTLGAYLAECGISPSIVEPEEVEA